MLYFLSYRGTLRLGFHSFAIEVFLHYVTNVLRPSPLIPPSQVVFEPLRPQQLIGIASLLGKELAERLAPRHIGLRFTDAGEGGGRVSQQLLRPCSVLWCGVCMEDVCMKRNTDRLSPSACPAVLPNP